MKNMTEPTVLTKQSERRARTRKAISDAGRTLFSQRPVDAVAIDDIVAAASVAKGSFYNHFVDKDALVEDIVGEIRANLEARVEAINAGEADAAHRVARAVCVYMRYAIDEPEAAELLARVQRGYLATSLPYNRAVVHDVEIGIAQQRFAIRGVEAGTIFILGIAQIAMVRIAQEPVPALAVVLAQQLGAMLLRALGVGGPEAEAIAGAAADAIVQIAPDGARNTGDSAI